MNIFDAHISGSLSVSASAEISNNLLVSGNLTVLGTVSGSISGSITNADSASFAPKYTLTSSFHTFTSSYNTGSFTGSFIGNGIGLYDIPASGITGLNLSRIAQGASTASISSTDGLRVNTNTEITGGLIVTTQISGSFKGDGTNLYNIPASGVTGLNLTRIADGSTTASISSTNGLRVNTNTEITGALIISGSITLNGVPVGTGKLDEVTFNTYTSSNDSTNSTQNSRLTSIESTTGSLNIFSSSIDTTIKNKLNTETVISGSVQVLLTGTTGYSTFSSSVSTSIGFISSSVAITTSGLSSSIGSLSSSVATTTNTLSSSISSSIGSISSSIGSLSSSLATTTSGLSYSIESLSSSIATTTSGITSTVTSLSSSVLTTTSGLSSSIGSLSSSLATTTLGTKNRVDSIESKTGSYATTGSNIFQGSQTITGSLYVSQDLIVAGSSSIQHISSSIVNISDNIITVNALNPSVRFGGLAVIDSGSSPQVSGSILFDSVNNQWLFVHQNQASVTSSVLLMGPETYNNLGNESYITQNKLVKSTGIEHLSDSNITDTGTLVSINSNSEVTGTLKVTGNITNPNISAIETSTGSLNTFTSSINTTIKSKLNADGVISGSSQIDGSQLGSNKTITIGSTSTTLGGTSTSLAGLTSVTSTAFTGSLQGNSTNITATSNTSLTSLANLATVGTITTGVWNGSAIGNSYLANSSFFVGTTSISLGRTSSSQTLTGVSIDGNSATVTNGVYTTGDQTIAGAKTFSSNITNSATADWYMYGFGARGANAGQYGMGLASDIANRTLSFHVPNLAAYSNSGNTPKFGWYSNGSVELMTLQSATGNLVVTGTINGLTVSSGTISSGTWNGTSIGDTYISSATNWNTAYNKRISTLGFTSSTVTITLADTTTVTASVPTFNQNTSGTAANITASSNTSLTSLANLVTVGTITTGVWNGTAIANAYLANSSFNIGTTSISLGRTSSSQTLTGVSIDGNSATVTNGVYTTGDQTIAGAKTFTGTINVTASEGREITTFMPSSYTTNDLVSGHEYGWYDDHWRLGMTRSASAPGADFVIQWNAARRLSLTSGGNLTVTGTISATNLSGTNTGDQTNITGTAGSETLATVTGRGASTSTAISINNTLTVTSGRIIARTGGANTYGIFSGYDNNNHMMSFRAAIAGSTSSPTITAGHQTTFIEYAEANDTTGWFFKSASTGTYEEIAKITRIGITPGSNGTQNLGSSSLRWNTVFTSDLSLSNGIGDYTIVEGENDLFLYNNKIIQKK